MGSIKSKIVSRLFPFLIFLLLSSFLVFSWFRSGFIYGGGDVGLQVYNSMWYLENARYIWWEVTAPGFPVPHGLTAVSLQFFLSILQNLGFSPLAMQASLFFLILLLMGYGMYLFCLSVIGHEKRFYAIVAGLFYILNPYTMIQVWHRFIHNTMVLAAALPFLVLFWVNWIRKGDYKSLIFFLLINLVAVYFYGSLAFIITVWLLFFLITLLEGIFPWTGIKNFIRIEKHFIIGLILWAFTNIWWLIPTFTVGPGLFSQQHSLEESVITLVNLGKQTIIPFTLQLINPFYLFQQLDFGKIYLSLPFMLIPWLFFFVILIGLIRGFYLKNIASWSVIFLVVILLAKGAAAPFGYLYILGFRNFYPLGIIRNPFEKIGILLPFVSSILFAFGLQVLFKYLTKRLGLRGSIAIISALLTVMVIYSWPMFLGKVFGTPTNTGFVEVPEDYKKTDNWIKSQGKDGKILHLPLPRGEDVQYYWRQGYNGLDPNSLLFTSLPSISHEFNLKMVDNELTTLSLIFSNPYSLYKSQALRLLQDFNVRFIVLHKDINWLGRDLYDPLETEEVLNNRDFLEKKVEFGNLVIYQIIDKFYQPKIILSDDATLIYPAEGNLFIWPRVLNETEQFISPISKELDKSIPYGNNQTLIFPKSSFVYGQASESAKDTIQDALKKLMMLKSYFDQNGIIPSRDLVEKLISSSQLLSEIIKKQQDSNRDFDFQLDNYQNIITKALEEKVDYERFQSLGSESILSSLFRLHLSGLEVLENSSSLESKDKILRIQSFLKQRLLELNLFSQYAIDDNQERQIFKFEVPFKNQYELLMTNSSIKDLYNDSLNNLDLSINGNSTLFKSKTDRNFLLFDKINLDPGQYEISHPLLLSRNLTLPLEQLSIVGSKSINSGVLEIKSSLQNPSYIEVPINNAYGGDLYKISLEAKITQGNGSYILLYENSEAYILNGREPQSSLKEFIPANPDWQRFTINIQLKLTSQTGKIIIFLPQPDNIFVSPTLLIRNLKVQRILTNTILLASGLTSKLASSSTNKLDNLERKSPVEYRGRIRIVKPTFMFFKETYHPSWELKLINEKQIYIPSKHFLGNLYGNAWYIDKTGDYDFEIQFKPQQFVGKGIIISVLTLIIILSFILIKNLMIKRGEKVK